MMEIKRKAMLLDNKTFSDIVADLMKLHEYLSETSFRTAEMDKS
jgi:hypothetical protein